jgi:hypothetical protein
MACRGAYPQAYAVDLPADEEKPTSPMDMTRTRPEVLEALVSLLPSKQIPCAYALKLRDGSVYIATSQHLSYRLYLIAKALNGDPQAKVSAVVRRRGVSHLMAFKTLPTEAQANAFAETWAARLRQRGAVIATDTLSDENRAADAAHLWSEDVAQITGDRTAAEDF